MRFKILALYLYCPQFKSLQIFVESEEEEKDEKH
jgi:hypothetical protein